MKKTTRKLLPALAMLLVSAVMMSTASFAWFSMNTTVTATGMSVSAEAAGSLIIGDGPNIDAVAGPDTVSINTSTQVLSPITYKKAGEGAHASATTTDAEITGYMWCNNAADVDHTTGLATTMYYTKLTGTGSGYCIMETVYLASSGLDIANKTLTATVEFTNGEEAALDTNQKAVSVVFAYDKTAVKAATSAELADFDDTKKVVATAASGSTNVFEVADSVTIPNVENGAIPVHILFYIDGEAAEGENAYVNSAAGNIEALGIKITFTVA